MWSPFATLTSVPVSGGLASPYDRVKLSAVTVSDALPTTRSKLVLALKPGVPLSVAVTVIVGEPSAGGEPENVRVFASNDNHAGSPLALYVSVWSASESENVLPGTV